MAPVEEAGTHHDFLGSKWKTAGRCIQELSMERVSRKIQE